MREFRHNGKKFLLTIKQYFEAQTIQLSIWNNSSGNSLKA